MHLCRTDGLTQLAGNAALFSIRVATEGVFSAEAGRERALLKRVVDGGRFTEQITHGHRQTCRSRNCWAKKTVKLTRIIVCFSFLIMNVASYAGLTHFYIFTIFGNLINEFSSVFPHRHRNLQVRQKKMTVLVFVVAVISWGSPFAKHS